MRLVPPGGNLVVSSSMPVRDLEWFAAPRGDVRVFSNRGANGIDGVTSTAVGVALSSTRPTVLLTGDVAFLHDSSALAGLRRRRIDLVIVVVHNDGGGIFSFLPQATALPTSEFETLYGTPHGTDLTALASAHGLPAEQVRTRAGATAALAAALHQGGPRVVVAHSDRHDNVAVHERMAAAVGDALRRAR
jgi:2-succinyl-5-enolpyruvyl-6-hydroxy-3-cyclohexene-1-carboxylate synthase